MPKPPKQINTANDLLPNQAAILTVIGDIPLESDPFNISAVVATNEYIKRKLQDMEISIDIQTIQTSINILRNNKLITSTKDGIKNKYSLTDKGRNFYAQLQSETSPSAKPPAPAP